MNRSGNDPVSRERLQSATPPAVSGIEPIRSDDFLAGDVIGGKYVVERVLGVGGVGIVLAARHTELDEIVAIKFLRAEVQGNADIVRRFAQEAKAAVRIKSEHAARVFDVGAMAGRGPYLVMEYLEGKDFADALATSGTLPVRRAVEAVLQVCEALAVAHSNDIVHRDIKPENMFLARRADGTEVVKVLDFGISKTALAGRSLKERAAPETEAVMGSPLYMSPEQIRGESTVDHRTDIWSLGVVLYEMLTGRPPFTGESVRQICDQVLDAEPVKMAKFTVDIPDDLQLIVDRCLAKAPARRFQNVAELAISLLPFGPSKGRIHAERASTILRASGHAGASVRFQSSMPPVGGGASSERIPGQPPVPSFPVPPGTTSSNPEAVEALAKEATRTRRIVTVASVAMLLLAAGVATMFVVRGTNKEQVRVATAALHRVSVESDPPGVRVESNGKLLGETPVSLQLPEGEFTLQLTKDDYAPESLTLTIAPADADKRARVTMKRTNAEVPVAVRSPHVPATALPPGAATLASRVLGAHPPGKAGATGPSGRVSTASLAPPPPIAAAAPPPSPAIAAAKPAAPSPVAAATGTSRIRTVDDTNRVRLVDDPGPPKVPQVQ